MNVDELRAEIQSTKKSLGRLMAAQEQITQDCTSKTKVWRLNDECSKVNPVKGLELDSSPAMLRRKKQCSRTSKGVLRKEHFSGRGLVDAHEGLERHGPRRRRKLSSAATRSARRPSDADHEDPQGEDDDLITVGSSKVRETLCNAVAEGQLQAAQESMHEASFVEAKSAEAPQTDFMPIPAFSRSRSETTADLSGSWSWPASSLNGSGRPPSNECKLSISTLRQSAEAVDVLMKEDDRILMSRRLSELKDERSQYAMQRDSALSSAPVDFSSGPCIRNLHQYFIFSQGVGEKMLDIQCSYSSAGPNSSAGPLPSPLKSR